MVKRSKENRSARGAFPEEVGTSPTAASASAPAAGGALEKPSPRRGPLDGALREAFALTWGRARELTRMGKVSVGGSVETNPLARVEIGDVLQINLTARRLTKGGGSFDDRAVVFVDNHVIVVRKAPGVNTIPYEGDESGTPCLDEQVRTYLGRLKSSDKRRGPAPLGVVHRIDKETSGLVVFTRTWLAKESLTAQFRAHTVNRRYLAIAHGIVKAATYRTHLVENRGDGLRGSFERSRLKHRPNDARLAITHVEPEEALEGATLVRCRLETGRTHQIRIHMSEAGHSIVGERVYSRDARKAAAPEIPAPRLMLHAAILGFIHPKTGQEISFEEPVPADFARVLAMLKK